METLPLIFRIVISAVSTMLISYFAQEQADRYKTKIAKFFQASFTVIIIACMIVTAGCLISLIWTKTIE